MKKEYYYILILFIFLSSCKHEIVADDIYAYWQLQNKVEFDDVAFGKLEITDDENWGCWVDPVISDTIYHFKSFAIDTDTLTFVDDNDKTFKCRIYELHDSVMVLKDFPGASDNLEFKRMGDTMREKNDFNNTGTGIRSERTVSLKFTGKTIYAKDISPDSLDVNMKSVVAQKYANYMGESVILTNEQVANAHNILKEYVDDKLFLKEHPNARDDAYPFNEYFKQYMGYMKDGELIVDVTMNRMVRSRFSPFPYMILKQDLISVNDGGPSHARATVNLSRGKAVWFMTNGY